MSKQQWKNLQCAFNIHHPLQRDPLIRFKRCGENAIVKLRRETWTTHCNEYRNACNADFAKYRMAAGYVDSIYDLQKDKFIPYLQHQWRDTKIAYQQQTVVEADRWLSNNNDIVCDHGIHYFLTLEAAFGYDWLHGCVKFLFKKNKQYYFLVFDGHGNLDDTNLLANPLMGKNLSSWLEYPHSRLPPFFP